MASSSLIHSMGLLLVSSYADVSAMRDHLDFRSIAPLIEHEAGQVTEVGPGMLIEIGECPDV